ncbi:MAG: hypothetical protein KIT72_12210 [Polyangiaceae bacterium]|nr:hypothetical protein [Polyangiaceae bacterium]MCW5791177.1 hypothetical protein [Polyangiaceae bacterium]
MLWLALALAALALCAWAWLASWRVELNLTGRGEPSGAWVLGGGARVGVVTLSAAMARGVPLMIHVHLFGKRVWRWRASEHAAEAPEPAEEPREKQRSKSKDRLLKVARELEPEAVLSFLFEQRERVRVDVLDITLDYSFEDVLLTGRLMAAVYALAWMLPTPVRIRQTVRWELVDRGAATLDLKSRVWPGKIALATLWFSIRTVWQRIAQRLRARSITKEARS